MLFCSDANIALPTTSWLAQPLVKIKNKINDIENPNTIFFFISKHLPQINYIFLTKLKNPEWPICCVFGRILLSSNSHSLSMSSIVFRYIKLFVFLTFSTKSLTWGIHGE